MASLKLRAKNELFKLKNDIKITLRAPTKQDINTMRASEIRIEAAMNQVEGKSLDGWQFPI